MKKNKKHMAPKEVLLARFTYDTWKQLFPDKTLDEWKETQCPACMSDFILMALSDMGYRGFCVDNVCKTTVVVLDEEYLEWLKKNEKADSEKVRREYGASLSEYDLNRLLEKNDMNKEYYLIGFPVALLTDPEKEGEKKISFPKEAYQVIREHLGRVLRDFDVWMPNYLLTPDDFLEGETQLMNMAEAEMDDKTKVTLMKFAMPLKMQPGDISLGIIPVVLYARIGQAALPVGYLMAALFEAQDHDYDFLGAGVADLIQEENPGVQVEFYPNLCDVDDLLDMLDDIEEM